MYIHRLVEEQIELALTGGKIVIVLGPRQVGKTTLVTHLIKKHGGQSLNLDLEVDRQRLFALASLSPQDVPRTLQVKEQTILAIDEAQRAPEVGRLVKGWYDAGLPLKIMLLGSSSLDLLDRMAEPLTGRNEKYYLLPLLFSEYSTSRSWFVRGMQTERMLEVFHQQLAAELTTHLIYGGYPEAATTDRKELYLENVAADYILKDVFQSDLIKSPDTIRRLLLLLSYQVGSEVSTSELAESLRTSRQTVEKYIDLLEQTFVIFSLPSFSTNPRKEISKSKKIYFWDTGIKNALQRAFYPIGQRTDIGPLWENWVIAEFAKRNKMRQLGQQLYFWRSRAGGEVDLVIKDRTGSLSAYEIKWSKRNVASRTMFHTLYGKKPVVLHRDDFAWHDWG